MGKKKAEKKGEKKGDKLKDGKAAPKQKAASKEVKRICITEHGPFGRKFLEERAEVEAVGRLLGRLPAVHALIEHGHAAEDVMMAVARAYTRMALLLSAWGQAGFPAADVSSMVVLRSDMRVLHELVVGMHRELASHGMAEGVKQ